LIVSKYMHFAAEVFKDRHLLLTALATLGYADVEQGERPALFGYRGRRAETADLVVRRQHIGRASNDLGFRRTPQGFVPVMPVISEYDRQTLLGGRFLVRLRAAYSEQVIGAITQRLRGTARRIAPPATP
jgi:hypothetical protein